jgi:hypothetical protein
VIRFPAEASHFFFFSNRQWSPQGLLFNVQRMGAHFGVKVQESEATYSPPSSMGV